MTKSLHVCAILFLGFIAGVVVAHPGHDHSSQWSGAFHLSAVLFALVAIGILALLLTRVVRVKEAPFGKAKRNNTVAQKARDH